MRLVPVPPLRHVKLEKQLGDKGAEQTKQGVIMNDTSVISLEKAIDRIEKEISTLKERQTEQSKVNSAIFEISTEIKILGLNITHILEDQREIKEELTTHSEKLSDATVSNLEFKSYVDTRLLELEISPAKTAMKEKDFIKNQILTAIITGLMVLLGTVFTNTIFKNTEPPKRIIERRESEQETKKGEIPTKIAQTEKTR